MVRKNASLKGVEPVVEMRPENVFASLESRGKASQVMLLYTGPLATRTRLFVRFGERREGQEWVQTRDVAMQSHDGEATAVIDCDEGAAMEGACFAFFAQRNGRESERVWDNAGRAMGYYLFDAKTGKVEAR